MVIVVFLILLSLFVLVILSSTFVLNFVFMLWTRSQNRINTLAKRTSYRYKPSCIRCQDLGPLVCGSTLEGNVLLSGIPKMLVGVNMHGTSDKLLDSYLQEYMWKKQHKG